MKQDNTIFYIGIGAVIGLISLAVTQRDNCGYRNSHNIGYYQSAPIKQTYVVKQQTTNSTSFKAAFLNLK